MAAWGALARAGGRLGRGPARAALRALTGGGTVPPRRGLSEGRRGALSAVLKDFERQYGRGAVVRLGDEGGGGHGVALQPTGVMTLDAALGGGLPTGRVVEVYGPESSGKTTLALQAAAACQARGGTAALIDAEHAFDPSWADSLGVDTANLVVCQPESGEMALNVVDQLARSSAVDMIVVDSVAALVPKAEIEGDMGAMQIGLQARLMSQALRRLSSNAARCNCTVVFVNQLRHKVGVLFGNPEVTSGGNALKYYSSVRMDIRRIATLDDRGIRVRVKVVKNKVAPPYKKAEFDILFGDGISKVGSLLDAAEEAAVVERRGSWYGYGETRLGQGRDKAVEFLRDNDEVRQEVEEDLRAALALPRVGGGAGEEVEEAEAAKAE